LLPTWASGARCLVGGETGLVLRHLIEHEGVRTAVVVTDEANGGFVEDRRSSAEPVSIDGAELSRHDRDDLHGPRSRLRSTRTSSWPPGTDTGCRS
jgi:hypothetical protein